MGGQFALAFDGPQRRFEVPWGTAASFGLHALLLVAIVLLSPLRQLVVPPPQPVAVEIVTQQQFAALTQPKTVVTAPPQLRAPPVPVPTTEAVAPPAPGGRLAPTAPLQPDLPVEPTHKATQFYSASILKEPKMARIRQTLTTFADSERVVQLCNIEGLEQIRRAEPKYDPDTLVGYAMSDFVSNGLTLSAAGGAFRSRRKWYGISFKCTVAPGYEGVTAFEFKLGDPIPRDEWEDHNLNAEDAEE
jgi:hypothetical protein